MEGSAAEKLFTQEEVNALVGGARKKERDKYPNYEEYKAAFEAQEAAAAEAAETREALGAANARVAELEAERQAREWAEQAASETGVPASILKGSTLEELQAHAEAIRAAMPAYPVLPADTGESKAPATTKEELYGIKDRNARVMAMGSHPEAFE